MVKVKFSNMTTVIGSRWFFITLIPTVFMISNNSLVLMGKERCDDCDWQSVTILYNPFTTISDYYNPYYQFLVIYYLEFGFFIWIFLYLTMIFLIFFFRFSNRDSIILHKKQHNQEKTHFCSICLKGEFQLIASTLWIIFDIFIWKLRPVL